MANPAQVPEWLSSGASIAARLLIITAAVAIVVFALAQIKLVVFPLIAALLLTTVLDPVSRRLADAGLAPALAALATLVGFLALIAGGGILLAPSVIDQLDQLDVSLQGGLNEVEEWLTEGPLNMGEGQVADAAQRVLDELRDQAGALTESAISGALVILEVIGGALLALVLTFFFLKDGRQIWSWLLELAPARRRHSIDAMGSRSWTTLGGYLRGLATSATIEAVAVGIALLVIGIPLVLPLAVLTFFGAFVPIVGAFVVGMLAALVALFSEGLVTAIVVVLTYVVIQQVEANVLHPYIVGRSVELHPVAVLIAVTAGGVLAGIPGAFLAVPIVAVLSALLGYVRERPGDSEEQALAVAG